VDVFSLIAFIFNLPAVFSLSSLTAGWIILFLVYYRNFRITQSIKGPVTFGICPSVSVIIPARNEQQYVKRCILSLLRQQYPKLELILVDDNSTDNTLNIAKSIQDPRLKIISLKRTPSGWTGKSWASQVGYKASRGQILLFTDSDAFFFNKSGISQAVASMIKNHAKVITGLPLIELRDICSKLVMPIYNLFSIYSTPSYRDLSNPKNSAGYLIGSFFLIDRGILDEIGGFTAVRNSIQEDTDLGMFVKKSGYSIGLIKVNSFVSALWSRNTKTLLEGIRRIVSYNLVTNRKCIIFETLSIFSLMILPFILLPMIASENENKNIFLWNILLCAIPMLAMLIVGRTRHRLNFLYSLLALFGSSFLLATYLTNLFSLFSLPISKVVRWKGRKYQYVRQESSSEDRISLIP